MGKVEANEKGEIDIIFPNALETTSSQYMQDKSKIEFGGRNSIEPHEPRAIVTYLKAVAPALELPKATAQTLVPARIYWENYIDSRRKPARHIPRRKEPHGTTLV